MRVPENRPNCKIPENGNSHLYIKQLDGQEHSPKETHIPKSSEQLSKETLNKGRLSSVTPQGLTKPPCFKDDFAEIFLNNRWVKVEIVDRNLSPGNAYLVQRLDGMVMGRGSR